MSYLRYLCFFALSGVQPILCLFCLSSSCVLCAQMLPVSLDCPFLIALSVFSNIYVVIESLDNVLKYLILTLEYTCSLIPTTYSLKMSL